MDPWLDVADQLAIETPAVLVDLDRMDAAIQRMAETMRQRGVALRPHAKTHKSIEIGRRQVGAGAVGLTVATIGEAEVFAEGGIEDLFIAYPLVPGAAKRARLARLAARCRLSVGVDSVDGAIALATGMAGDHRPSVLIEVDTGGRRSGVRPEDAGPLARRVADLDLPLAGVFSHAGHGYAGPGKRIAAADDEVTGLAVAADSLRAVGLPPRVISAGSTPTATLSARPPITEERPGTYVLGDRQQAALLDGSLDDVAIAVAATVVSHGTQGGFLVDAGAKILGKDVASYIPGHGAVLGYPDAVITRVNDHHGVAEVRARTRRPQIGEVVFIVPNHVCPVVNLVDELVIVSRGHVVDRWPVDARGRNS